MSGAATEGALREWRYGQTQAERMVAGLLHLEGYEGVDPQHPLGGPDGLKDVLCRKDGALWIGAAYFPTTLTSFAAIGLPESVRGRFRAVQVWLGPAGSKQSDASHIPPPPEQIELLVSDFLTWWHLRHRELRAAEKADIANGLSEFHHRFLSIHPFLDANGRVGRLLLDQASRELLNQGIGSEFTADPKEYYAALRTADDGDLGPLRQRILASLT